MIGRSFRTWFFVFGRHGLAFGTLRWVVQWKRWSWPILVVGILGCPQPQPPPYPDASDAQALADALPDGGVCAAMCANLRRLSCPEGLDPKCIAVCEQNQAQRLTALPLACWASAATKEAARACGDSRTGHLRCE